MFAGTDYVLSTESVPCSVANLGFYPKILGFFQAVGILWGVFSGKEHWDFSNQRVIESHFLAEKW